jgi:hypothetical protein
VPRRQTKGFGLFFAQGKNIQPKTECQEQTCPRQHQRQHGADQLPTRHGEAAHQPEYDATETIRSTRNWLLDGLAEKKEDTTNFFCFRGF